MQTGHLVSFTGRPHPFRVSSTPCNDPDCPCTVSTLEFQEMVPPGTEKRDTLTFSLRVCLKHWTEQTAPPRSTEVEELAREFLARFPESRIRELAEDFQRARRIQERLLAKSLPEVETGMVSYAEVIDERGGIRRGVLDHALFFMFEGRSFFVEDFYCGNPDCDCDEVVLEFWEERKESNPKPQSVIRYRAAAGFRLQGAVRGIRFHEDSEATTRRMLNEWSHRFRGCFDEFQTRYRAVKAIAARGEPCRPDPSRAAPAAAPAILPPPPAAAETLTPSPVPTDESGARVGRNDPCPCGSGRKFKRCCARSGDSRRRR